MTRSQCARSSAPRKPAASIGIFPEGHAQLGRAYRRDLDRHVQADPPAQDPRCHGTYQGRLSFGAAVVQHAAAWTCGGEAHHRHCSKGYPRFEPSSRSRNASTMRCTTTRHRGSGRKTFPSVGRGLRKGSSGCCICAPDAGASAPSSHTNAASAARRATRNMSWTCAAGSAPSAGTFPRTTRPT